MGFVLLLFFFYCMFQIGLGAAQAAKRDREALLKMQENKKDFVVEEKKEDFIVENRVKFCPPHKWRYQEVCDQEGKVVRHRLICDLCGPLKPIT